MPMNVTSALFEVLEPGSIPGFALRIYAAGSGFSSRAVPVLARVGAVTVEQIFLGPAGAGFTGLLATRPNHGDRLFVRYADEKEFSTDVIFGRFSNA
jgi:hypothetical protein